MLISAILTPDGGFFNHEEFSLITSPLGPTNLRQFCWSADSMISQKNAKSWIKFLERILGEIILDEAASSEIIAFFSGAEKQSHVRPAWRPNCDP
jgi:hypothetical protein